MITYVCNDGVSIMLGYKVFYFARRRIGQSVASNEVVRDIVLLGVGSLSVANRHLMAIDLMAIDAADS